MPALCILLAPWLCQACNAIVSRTSDTASSSARDLLLPISSNTCIKALLAEQRPDSSSSLWASISTSSTQGSVHQDLLSVLHTGQPTLLGAWALERLHAAPCMQRHNLQSLNLLDGWAGNCNKPIAASAPQKTTWLCMAADGHTAVCARYMTNGRHKFAWHA